MPESAHKRREENLWLKTAATVEGHLRVEFEIPATGSSVRFVELMEAQRQAAIVYAHHCLGVAADAVFVLSAISLELTDTAVRQPLPGGSGTIAVRPAVGRTAPTIAESAWFEINIGSDPIALGSVTARFLRPRVYERIRRPDIVPVPEQRTAALIESEFDLSDPLLSDHAVDHVPAMAVVARLEQALSDPETRLQRLSIAFRGYLETHLPTSLEIDDLGNGAFSGSASQMGQVRVGFDGQRGCTRTAATTWWV